MVMTAQAVLDRVKRQFGDESGVQITDTDIIRWINDGQREIVSKNGILQARATTDVRAGVAEYTFPLDQVLHVVALKYRGRRLRNLPYQEAEDYFTNEDPSFTSSGDPEIWTTWAGTFRLYPTPSTDAMGELVLDYVRMPTDVTSSASNLVIPDRYFNSLVSYVLAQAYEQDEDWTASQNKAAQFSNNLTNLLEEENRPQQEYYPFITVLED